MRRDGYWIASKSNMRATAGLRTATLPARSTISPGPAFAAVRLPPQSGNWNVLVSWKSPSEDEKAAGEFYLPSRYRLTYLHTKHGGLTDEWKRVQMQTIATLKNRNPGAKMPPDPGAKTPLKFQIPGG